MSERNGWVPRLALTAALIALSPGIVSAITRDIAELQPARLSFNQSILNQLSHGTYRDPFDELQTRPYNLLFSNIGRHPNLSPWPDQEGSHTRYLNALIGNNGAANVDNGADSLQGALIRRETAALAWGGSAAFFSGSEGSDDANGSSTFSDRDDLEGFELRAGAARQLSQRSLLGAGLRVVHAGSEVSENSFEPGVGGFVGTEKFQQSSVVLDVGLRQFLSASSSWEAQIVIGSGSVEQDEFSEDIDGGGAVTDLFMLTNYDIADRTLGVHAGYSRLKFEGIGETEFRAGYERNQRELDNTDLAYSESAGAVTPSVTLVGQDPVTATRAYVSARSIFQAGETEMFTGAQLDFGTVQGGTQVDAAGTVVSEVVDDSQKRLGVTVGLRQPLFRDKLRFLVSGSADLVDQERATTFDTGADLDDSSRSTSQYAIGLEGVLANVTFDIAWLGGEEASVVPAPLGLPSGSRRAVDLDILLFSAAVAW